MRNILSLMLFLQATGADGNAQEPRQHIFKHHDTKGDCETYISDVDGKRYVAARTTCLIAAPLDAIRIVLGNVASFPKWMADCTATRVLRLRGDDNEVRLFWYRQHVPIFKDRDMVLETEVESARTPGVVAIRARSTNETRYQSDDNCVRMPSFYAEWILERVDQNHTLATYLIDPDLGDGLPIGPANRIIAGIPYRTLVALAEMVE
jgi:hypothetical protein